MSEAPLRRVKRLSYELDERFRVPGTSFRFGWDALIGLIPGMGDIMMTLTSLYLLYEARQMGAPVSLLLRMLGNILIETVVGAIPFLGDVFDFFWKANTKNAALLDRYFERPRQTARASLVWVLLFGTIVVIAVGLSFYLLYRAFEFLISSLGLF